MIEMRRIEELAVLAATEPSTGDAVFDGFYQRCSEWGWEYMRSPYYLFLYLLAKELAPKCCVELGVAQGLGSILMAAPSRAEGMKDPTLPIRHVVGVDIVKPGMYPEAYEIRPTLKDILHHWNMDTVEAADRYAKEGYGPVGLIFIDSTHTRTHARREFEAWRPHLANECVLVADDIIHADNNTELPEWFEQDLPGEKKLFPDTLHRPDNCIGVAIIRG